jgi:hypothetical protein
MVATSCVRSFDKGSFESRVPTGPPIPQISAFSSKRTKPNSETGPLFAIPVPFPVYSAVSVQTFLKTPVFMANLLAAVLPILFASSAKLNHS